MTRIVLALVALGVLSSAIPTTADAYTWHHKHYKHRVMRHHHWHYY